jgi:SAM-dependent methyltransferase
VVNNWDKIYQEYVRGKVHPVLRSDNISPEFRDFVETSAFSVKVALDIGCGRGRYLEYLEDLGFAVSGIDSSPTAIALGKTVLSSKANLVLADMFDYGISKNEFDLIFSIAALHHGKKEEVNNLINHIISASRANGKIFITLPIYPEKGLIRSLCKKIKNEIKRFISVGLPNWRVFKTLKVKVYVDNEDWQDRAVWIGDGERLPISGPEKGLIHSHYKKEELDKLFSDCLELTIEKKGEAWIIKATAPSPS